MGPPKELEPPSFFWPNVSLESVKRECRRTGDGYQEGYQNGAHGYWIIVLNDKDSNTGRRRGKSTTSQDHRVRSDSPLPLENTTRQSNEKEESKREKDDHLEVPLPDVGASKKSQARNRKPCVDLSDALESLLEDDNKSVWEGSNAGAAFGYVTEGIIGKGSFGTVDKVSAKGYTGIVARKCMYLQTRKKKDIEEERDRIQREVGNLQRAKHEHVVMILDCYRERPSKALTAYYLIMAPVGEQDLETLIHQFPGMSKSEREKYKGRFSMWFTCLASALAYMHMEGVRHEDIKPTNVIYRGDTVFFTDFSSSRLFKPDFETATTGAVAYTRRFAAPEVLDTSDDQIHIRAGNAEKDGKDERGNWNYKVPHGRQSDVFSLGLVFAEMTTVFNKSLDEMHEFVLVSDKSGRKQSYHEALDRLRVWFTKELRSYRGLQLWKTCLHAMLREKRKSRPSALDIVHILQQ